MDRAGRIDLRKDTVADAQNHVLGRDEANFLPVPSRNDGLRWARVFDELDDRFDRAAAHVQIFGTHAERAERIGEIARAFEGRRKRLIGGWPS